MPIAGRGDKWLQSFVPYLMYRITNQLNRRLRSKLRREGINISRWRVLAVLRAYGRLSLGRIVDLTSMEQPSVSRIVAQLEREGLVRRKISQRDSRFVNVILTPVGEKAFDSIYPTADRHQNRALLGFSTKEIKLLTEFLHRIQANVEAEE
ncbi:MAG TPA: MarR family transcriptional regulator [Woeseiaceae bacterium]|nr:MarR family transcriptional regulator [Woeseiaceae bacterium]